MLTVQQKQAIMKTQKKTMLYSAGQSSRKTGAFTLVELVVVILTIAILGALLLPALANPQLKDQEMTCLNNVKQLQIAWMSYAGDNAGKIPQNVANGGTYSQTGMEPVSLPGRAWASWVLGDAINPTLALITNGLIYPYVGNWQSYKCPADVKLNSTNGPTLRSYSMNAWMNSNPQWAADHINFKTLAGINSNMPPALALVFIEENPASINDGYWVQDLDFPTLWVDVPAVFHLNAGCMSFADGHCQTRKWTDRNVLAGVFNGGMGFSCDPTSGDLAWVQARCTVPRH